MKKLREGVSTGSCMTGGAEASVIWQTTGKCPSVVKVDTPIGKTLYLDIIPREFGRTVLFCRQIDLAETGSGAGGHQSEIVGDLGKRHGTGLDSSGYCYEGIQVLGAFICSCLTARNSNTCSFTFSRP